MPTSASLLQYRKYRKLVKELRGVIHGHVKTSLVRICKRDPSMGESVRRVKIVLGTAINFVSRMINLTAGFI